MKDGLSTNWVQDLECEMFDSGSDYSHNASHWSSIVILHIPCSSATLVSFTNGHIVVRTCSVGDLGMAKCSLCRGPCLWGLLMKLLCEKSCKWCLLLLSLTMYFLCPKYSMYNTIPPKAFLIPMMWVDYWVLSVVLFSFVKVRTILTAEWCCTHNWNLHLKNKI